MSACCLYFFSATGNSLAVALELTSLLQMPEPISIPGSMVLDDPYAAARNAECVGFVFPVHRATLPEMVRGFIVEMPVRPDCYYFAISTYTLFGCNEFWDVDEILCAQGARLNYGASIQMMGNVGLLAPDTRTVQRRREQMREQAAEISEAVANHQENYFRRSNKLLGRLVAAFTSMRRRSISFKVDGSCTRCGVCAQVCPAQNITVDKDGAHAPVRSDKCEACLACVHWCPANALSTQTPLHSHYHNPDIKPEQLNPHARLESS
ncbi:MAG: EFR1 family ferrodoxin [Coriobacteriales bacterium]|jgi:ferredoxin|nr:EFR1 family ferrodoxin [Coriobacteriales bacterium]